MNLTDKIELKLFYTKAIGEKDHYKVRWTKYRELWNGLKFIGYSTETELRMSGNFTTKAGAEGFINNLIKHIPAFTGWFEIIEFK